MEEQVGMMAHNEAYKRSVEEAAAGGDDLYQESMKPNFDSKELIIKQLSEETEPAEKEALVLNPLSANSSVQVHAQQRNSQDVQAMMARDMQGITMLENQTQHVASDQIKIR